MPRQKRADEAGAIYHALNRGNKRQTIFHKDGDYQAFLGVFTQGLELYPVKLLAYVLMPNHWHMVRRPTEDGGMGWLLSWVTATHTLRYHAHYRTSGESHMYQAGFMNFPVENDGHFLVLGRYTERNPLRAGMVSEPRTGSGVLCGSGCKSRQSINFFHPGRFPERRTGFNE